jgi:hypothetical protein
MTQDNVPKQELSAEEFEIVPEDLDLIAGGSMYIGAGNRHDSPPPPDTAV